MDEQPIENSNAPQPDYSKLQWSVVPVHFDVDAVAEALGLPGPALTHRMLASVIYALTRDATLMAAEEMRLQGKTFHLDGYPDGWPLAHLVAIARYRLLDDDEARGAIQ